MFLMRNLRYGPWLSIIMLFTRYLDINDKYAAGEQVDLNTQNEYYGSVGLLYTPIKYVCGDR